MYDVTIIGAGVSSIFMAYSLAKSNKKVLILDKGKALEDRHCPLDEGKCVIVLHVINISGLVV